MQETLLHSANLFPVHEQKSELPHVTERGIDRALRVDVSLSVLAGRHARTSPVVTAVGPKVLVVVRYSPVCRRALELAARLATVLGGELLVLALIPIGVRATGTGAMHTNDQRPVELTHLKAFVKEALGTRPTVPYEPIIAFALSVQQYVAEIAAARRADLIVVGDSRGPLHRRLPGGLANRIRVTAPCPVVVVNRECRSSLFTSARRPAPTAALRPQPAQRGDGAGSFLGSSVTGTRAVEGRP